LKEINITYRIYRHIFLITFIFTQKNKSIEKAVSETHSCLKKKHKARGGVLHCYREKPITRERLLRKLNNIDCSIMTIYLNKKKVHAKLKDEKAVLYNYVTNILLDRIITKKILPLNQKITLIASRKETNKFLNENFKNYLTKSTKDNHKINIEIFIKTPHEEKSLQAVDFASWAIFRKQEKGDETYYNLIKEKIVEENPLFP
jgi:hypothetical protein